MAYPELSVIICTYNRAQILAKSLETLKSQDLPPEKFELVVVDDGSPDDTARVVKSYTPAFPVRYVGLPRTGRAGARNAGLKNAEGKIALFVDDDVLLPAGFLSLHYRIHQKGEKLIGRGPIIDIDKMEMPQDQKAKLPDYSAATFCTCNASVSRSGFLAVGGFDEDFKEYGWEDNEAGMRLLKAGYRPVFMPEAYLYHFRPLWKKASLEQMKQKAEEMGRTAAIFYSKHPNLRVKLATGNYWLIKGWGALTANSLVARLGYRMWQKDLPEVWERFWGRRIFLYHYLASMRKAMKELKEKNRGKGLFS